MWLQGWSLSLAEMNYFRTGFHSEGLLDVHYLTDEKIRGEELRRRADRCPRTASGSFPSIRKPRNRAAAMSPSPKKTVHRFAHEAMATVFEIFVADREESYAGQAARAAFDEVDRLERLRPVRPVE